MKKVSNTIIGLSFFLFFLVAVYIIQSSKNSKNLETELKKFTTGASENVVEISNPIFKSKGLNSNSYIIKAKKGIQIEEDIELHDINAEFEGEDKNLYYVSADKGLYSQLDETIELFNNIIIFDQFDNKTFTEKALIDIKNKKITLSQKVISISSNSSITSDSSIVDDVSKVVTYLGNVKVKIENE